MTTPTPLVGGPGTGTGETGQPSVWRALPARVLAFFLAADLVVVGLYVLASSTAWIHLPVAFDLVDLNQEANFPTWYSTVQLLLIGLALLALASPLFRGDEALRRVRGVWLAFGIGFLYFSADEGGVIHERLSQLGVIAAGGPKGLSHILSAGILAHTNLAGRIKGGGLWIPIYLVVMVVVLAALAPQILRVIRTWPRETALFLTGFVILFAGGVIIEAVSGAMHLHGASHLAEVGVEEFFELLGQSIALFGVVSLLAAAAEAALARLAASAAGTG